MENSKRSFVLKIFVYNLPWLAILFTIQVGLWTMSLTLLDVLTAKADRLSITLWCWIFLVSWSIYFCLSFNKLHRDQKEKSKKAKYQAEKDRKEAKDKAQKEQKEKQDHQDQVTYRKEMNEKLAQLTKAQAKDFKALNSQIESVKNNQTNLECQMNANQASSDQIEKNLSLHMEQLYKSIDEVNDKLATHSADEGKICNDNLNNYSNQFSEQSIGRASCYSSKSL